MPLQAMEVNFKIYFEEKEKGSDEQIGHRRGF
jgi:hypothetical protein